MDDRVILLVEDNRDDEELTLRAFQRNQITNPVVVARNGMEALDYLFGHGTYADRDPYITPQLVLMDLKLPKMSGLEVLRQIRGNRCTRFIPVVVLTTSTEEQDLFESYSLHANSYIHKPVDFPQFIQMIGQLGMYWLSLNKTPLYSGKAETQWAFHSVSC